MVKKEGEETRETADLKNKGREGSFVFPKKEWHHWPVIHEIGTEALHLQLIKFNCFVSTNFT